MSKKLQFIKAVQTGAKVAGTALTVGDALKLTPIPNAKLLGLGLAGVTCATGLVAKKLDAREAQSAFGGQAPNQNALGAKSQAQTAAEQTAYAKAQKDPFGSFMPWEQPTPPAPQPKGLKKLFHGKQAAQAALKADPIASSPAFQAMMRDPAIANQVKAWKMRLEPMAQAHGQLEWLRNSKELELNLAQYAATQPAALEVNLNYLDGPIFKSDGTMASTTLKFYPIGVPRQLKGRQIALTWMEEINHAKKLLRKGNLPEEQKYALEAQIAVAEHRMMTELPDRADVRPLSPEEEEKLNELASERAIASTGFEELDSKLNIRKPTDPMMFANTQNAAGAMQGGAGMPMWGGGGEMSTAAILNAIDKLRDGPGGATPGDHQYDQWLAGNSSSST